MKINILINKMLIILLVILLLFSANPIIGVASDLDSIISGADGFVTKGKESSISTMNSTGVKNVSDDIYNMLLGVGILIVLVVGSFLGIKFMMASAEDKAKLKEALIPYIVGSSIIFGAFGIWKIMITIGNNI